LQVREVTAPQAGAGPVLVRLHAAGVNPVDTYIRSGNYARLPELPYTPGTDGAGRVEALGAGVTGLVEGQRVYVAGSLTGTYAEACLCEAAQVHALPEEVSFPQGAAIGVPYATAYRALFQRARAVAGETVLIHGGTGGTGTAAVQLAKAARLRVLATGGSEEGRAELRALGVEAAFDHHAAGYEEEIMKHTGGRGVEVIVEMLANVNLGRDLTLLAKGGRVAVIGSRGPVEINPRDAMAREADVRGVMLFAATAEELAEIHRALGEGLRRGELKPVVGEQFSLAQAAQAQEAVMRGGAKGKVVIVM
jgi:NADPH2:quinone reductase